MVDIRFISLVLGLLFLLNAIRDYSCVHAHQQDWENGKDKLVIPEYKELVDGFATTSTRKLGVGGRKMVAHEVLMRRKFEKEPSAFHGGASKDISGANCSDVKCNFEVKGNLRVKYIFGEQTASTKKRKKKKKLKEAGFVAFGDDYHGPKHHIPKHN